MTLIRNITAAAAFFVTMMASADISQRACRSQFSGIPGETTLYRARQSYTHDQYMGIIQNINQAAQAVGAPHLWMAPVQSGARSMLVVGDLDSDFAHHEMRSQEQNVIQSVVAAGLEGTHRYSLRYASRYPENFAGVLPQNLDLINSANNQRVTFQEILAFFEVSYILENGTEAEILATLKNLIEHLKQGGVLRVYPFNEAKLANINSLLDQILATTPYRFERWNLRGVGLPDARDRSTNLRLSSTLVLRRGADAP